jgi:long-chain fatty acid transport protein
MVILALPQLGLAGLYTAPMNPTDNTGPESAWANPAGMSGLKTSAVTVGVGGLIPNYKWDTTVNEAGGDNGGNSGSGDVLPSVYFVTPVGDKFHFGLSYFTPLGGVNGLGWDFGDTYAGRYGSQLLTFASNSIAVSGSWQANDKWSFGVGVSEQWLNVNFSAAINTPNLSGDGQADMIDLSDWKARWFLGTHYQASPATSVGLVYRSKWTPELAGQMAFSNLHTEITTTDFKFKLPLPQQIELGIQHALSETWILGLTFDWENWTQFNNMLVGFDYDGENPPDPVQIDPNWKNTYSAGANLTKIFAKGATFLNFGFDYGSSPVTDKNRIIQLPADDSWTLSIGVAHNFSKALTGSLGGGLVFGGSSPVEQVLQGFQFAGHMRTNRVLILGGSLAWRF